jgi:hypothetical protein
MAFLAPAFALAGEAVATFAVETVAPAAFDAACALGDWVFGIGEYEPLAEEEVEVMNVNTREYFGGASDEEVHALLDNHLAENVPEADDALVELVEHGASDETPGIQETLLRLKNDPAFRNEMMKKAAYTAIASGAAVGAEQLAVHAYAYAINKNPPSEILTHHETITGSLPNNPHIDPIYSPAYSPAADYMAPTRASKKYKRTPRGPKIDNKTMREFLRADAARSKKTALGYSRLKTATIRHYYPVNFDNYTLTGPDKSRVMPLLHQWNGAENVTGITLGIARGTGPSDRIGDIATIRKIDLTISVRYPNPGQLVNEKWNFYLIYDNDYDRQWPVPAPGSDWGTQFFFEAGGLRQDSVRTRNGLNRFTILKKMSLNFNDSLVPSYVGTSGVGGTLTYPPIYRTGKLICSMNKPIIYDATDQYGVYNQIRHGQIYLVACGADVAGSTMVPTVYIDGNIEFEP